jgi:uncharacterized lipoprotein YajG
MTGVDFVMKGTAMKTSLTLVTILLLAGCGADGAPTAPQPASPPQTGITLSGDGYAGVVIN